MHVLWLCDQARAMWLSVSDFLFLTQKHCRSFSEILETLFVEGSGFKCALIAMIAWCLWERQNRVREVNEPGSFMRLVTGLEIWFRSTGIFTLRRNRSLFGLLLFGVLLLQLNVTRLILMPLSWKVQTR